MNEVVVIVVLLGGALALVVSGRLARRVGLPEAVGFGATLSALALVAALVPAGWQARWAGGGGDRLLPFARVAGLAGLLFLAGTRFEIQEVWKARRLSLFIVLANSVLYALAVVLLRAFGWQNYGAIILVASAVVGASLWLPGELLRYRGGDNKFAGASQGAALLLTALSMLVIHFYAIFSAITGRRAIASVYTIVALYESLKLLVFFGFAYFISSRFLSRAEGRIPRVRIQIGFMLIVILCFVLAALTVSQLGALAWAFIAGAVWRQSEVGQRFSESERPVASATLMSFALLPALLQVHGRGVTNWVAVALAVAAALALKFAFSWVGAMFGSGSTSTATWTAAATLASSEVAVMFLGFGVTRWVIEGPAYYGILLFALISLLLSSTLWRLGFKDKGAEDIEPMDSLEATGRGSEARAANKLRRDRQANSGKKARSALAAFTAKYQSLLEQVD